MSKNTQKRRLVATSVFAATALVLAACSGGTTDPAPSTPGAGGSSDGGKQVSVDYWHRLPSVDGAKTVDELVAQWNTENPNIKVTATAMQGSANETYPKIAAAVEAGNAPCLAQIGVDRVPDLLSTGQLLDVTADAAQYKDSYLEYAWGRSTFGDQTYGLPQDTGPIVLYYRTDLFKKYGVEVPVTWDDYRAAGEKIRAADSKAYIGSFLPDESMWFMALSSANGATWWDIQDDAWKVAVDEAPTQQVAEYWQGLIDDDVVATIPRWDPNFDKSLNDGSLVATIGASWEAPLIANSAPDTAGKWGVAQLPAWDASNPLVGGGSVVGVLKGCEAPAEALAFTNWLNTNVDGLMPLGLFPATKAPAAGFETPDDLKAFYGDQNIYAEFSGANENVNVNWSFSPTTGVAMTALQDGTGKMLQGGPGLTDIVKATQKASVDSLKAAGISVSE